MLKHALFKMNKQENVSFKLWTTFINFEQLTIKAGCIYTQRCRPAALQFLVLTTVVHASFNFCILVSQCYRKCANFRTFVDQHT